MGSERVVMELPMSKPWPAPRVSIITATLNAEHSILRTLRSLEQQTFRDFEWLVIDGGSQDGTMNELKERADAVSCVVSERDGGIYDAWNKGLALARGEWIAFLGAGDTYEPDGLANYVEVIAQGVGPEAVLVQYVSSRVRLFSGDKCVRTIGKAWTWAAFRNWMCVAHVGSLHHRTLFEGGRRFDTSYRICGDYEFLLRCGPSLRTRFVPTVTASMLTGGASDSLERAAREAEKAKVSTGTRHPWVARSQRVLGLGKAYARRALWY